LESEQTNELAVLVELLESELKRHVALLEEILSAARGKYQPDELGGLLAGWAVTLAQTGRRTRAEIRRFLDAAAYRDSGFLICSAQAGKIEARFAHYLDVEVRKVLGL